MQEVRVRFAPSPTGFLHVGGARTALYNWLFARASKGKFLLRIEDTDRERSEQRFTDDILASLTWLGLDWDEPPIYQSKRQDRYDEVIQKLLSQHLAYRCDCTIETLDSIRKKCELEKRPFRYPGTCRDKSGVGSKHVIRLKMRKEGETAFSDQIRGSIAFQNRDLDDWVIARNDGTPTYNFSVVIDDHDQRISHVLRGDDHINNTPKQIQLYQALELEAPLFAHLPMILGSDRSKLSKRHGAASTLEYRAMGYLPEALINFLVRLGWSHGDQEVFSVDQLKEYFSLEKIGKANAIFNTEKLTWLSGIYFRDTKTKDIATYLRKYFANDIGFSNGVSEERMERGIAIIQGKIKTIPELIQQLICLFGVDPSYPVEKLKAEERSQASEILKSLRSLLSECDFKIASLEGAVRGEAERRGLKLAPLAFAVRFAVTGGRVSPGLFEMLEAQGKETVVRRFDNCLAALERG